LIVSAKGAGEPGKNRNEAVFPGSFNEETMSYQEKMKDSMQKCAFLVAGLMVALILWSAPGHGEEAPEIAYHDHIVAAGQRHQVDTALIKAIIMAESGYDPRAVSHRGAKGLMQLMPGTARDLGVPDVFDPEHNIHGGVKYFRFLLDEVDGQVRLALAAYNAGLYNVKKYEGVPPFKATRRYIRKVMKYYRQYLRTEDPLDRA
jgi:soluble lytic murein transglycosylase-like protein